MVGRFSFRRGDDDPHASRDPLDHDDEHGGRRRWIVPLVTFAVGAALGGGGVGMIMARGDEPPPPAPAATSASPTTGESAQVAVPRACLRIADEAQVLQQQLDQAMAAARDLNASRLSDLVRQIDEQQSSLRQNTEVCRQGVATATAVPNPTVTTVTVPPTPGEQPSPATTERTASPTTTTHRTATTRPS